MPPRMTVLLMPVVHGDAIGHATELVLVEFSLRVEFLAADFAKVVFVVGTDPTAAENQLPTLYGLTLLTETRKQWDLVHYNHPRNKEFVL